MHFKHGITTFDEIIEVFQQVKHFLIMIMMMINIMIMIITRIFSFFLKLIKKLIKKQSWTEKSYQINVEWR